MTPRLSRWTLTGALLLASSALAQAVPQELSVAVGGQQTLSTFVYSFQVATLEASYQRAAGLEGFWRSLYYGGGLRLAYPLSSTQFPLEGFLRAELRAHLGVWEPAAGFEVGAGRIARLPTQLNLPAEVAARLIPRLGPVYAAVNLAPLRFRLGGVVLGGPEAQLGANGPPFGGVTRIQLGLVRVEVQL